MSAKQKIKTTQVTKRDPTAEEMRRKGRESVECEIVWGHSARIIGDSSVALLFCSLPRCSAPSYLGAANPWMLWVSVTLLRHLATLTLLFSQTSNIRPIKIPASASHCIRLCRKRQWYIHADLCTSLDPEYRVALMLCNTSMLLSGEKISRSYILYRYKSNEGYALPSIQLLMWSGSCVRICLPCLIEYVFRRRLLARFWV